MTDSLTSRTTRESEDGPSVIELFMGDGRIIFRDQAALDAYVSGAPRPALLTDAERAAVNKAGELWGDLCRIVGDDTTRDADLAELVVHIHAIQHAVMAQAAARAYPEEFRLMGGTLVTPDAGPEGSG